MKLTQNEQEREQYEARRKWQLDYNTGMKVARMEGRQEGREEGREEGLVRGEKIGVIHLCEQLLQQPSTPSEELAKLSLLELTRLVDDLQARAIKQN